ncbi:MAG: glycoside hydrolase family 65 protein [Bacteroidales bacterium]|nr:glycoside hydrolase family 65 protein [Bacteroidales bacterium]
MNNYLEPNEWCIIEKGLKPENNRSSESIFSIGNGRMGQRANFEEKYSGDSLQGNYIAGIYYPDKTRVGWWKNGYPEYFAKVLNAPNWIGINIDIDGEPLDLAKNKIEKFERVLDMKNGLLKRSFIIKMPNDKKLKVDTERFLSIVDNEIGAIKYSVTPLNFNGEILITPYIDANITNEDSNYDEKFWDEINKKVLVHEGYITTKTKKLDFHVCTAMKFDIYKNQRINGIVAKTIEKEKFIGNTVKISANIDDEITVIKFGVVVTSENHDKSKLMDVAKQKIDYAYSKTHEIMFKEHTNAWAEKWEKSDITIDSDIAAQQAIRFNIFQLYQTYTGEDERLNIGPKGFTGEKYGGSTYWDTEAFCLPFYLRTSEPQVAKNLLLYRYKHLNKAIENAEKLGFSDGAALYPMVTMNGEECHNEWEITFEEIHRNGAIAFAIYNYIRYSGDKSYLSDYGLEVLIGISRFWKQRVNFSNQKNKYVMLGVTGPNEYENNINNNWYTNKIACWTMSYTIETINYLKKSFPKKYNLLKEKLKFDEKNEAGKWKKIIDNMYFPEDKELNIFLQQDGYMDKEQVLVKDLKQSETPINQNWSWDRILRSCFIKQADVLQGIYLFEDKYDTETIKRNFDFYESRTVHESSLSPCIHSIIASRIGDINKAYELYLRTARLDLDDYNNEVAEGLHITSMAGTWLSIVEGFGGMRIQEDQLYFNPSIPEQWNSFSFKILFRGNLLKILINKQKIEIFNQSNTPISLMIKDKKVNIHANKQIICKL